MRAPGRILEHRKLTLTFRPEQRRMIWARVLLASGETVCVANLHASAGLPEKASAEVLAAAAHAVEWSGGDPLVFGGDTNLRPARTPAAFIELRERFGLGDAHGAARDRPPPRPRPRRGGAAARGCAPEERELPRGDGLRLRLSDHAPVIARFEVG